MSFILIFVSFIISCFVEKIKTVENNILNMNNKLIAPYLNIQNNTNTKNIRKLQEPHPINIFVDITQLERQLEGYDDDLDIIKGAIEKAKETIQKLIKIKTKTSTINIMNYISKLDTFFKSLF